MVADFSLTHFAQVDDSPDARLFIEFLDARSGFAGERGVKELEISMLAIAPGNVVLDVGCGTGDDVREVAGLVGPGGKVVGLDVSCGMIEESCKRASGSGLPVEFVLGNAYGLEFPDQSFDRARADRLFVHLQAPERALVEMVRVLRPGGRIVVSDPDCDTIFVDSPKRETTRKVIHSLCDRSGSGMVGRELPRLFKHAGLSNIACVPRVLTMDLTLMHRLFDGHLAEPAVASMFAPGEIDCWWQEAARAEAEGRLHVGVTVFTTIGEKLLLAGTT
jgi:ubiquinone/menaquinone biosynthesis C-methylase UbiE